MGNEGLTFLGYQGRRILRLYHLYRLAIGVALVLLTSNNLHTELIQLFSPRLFRDTAWLYLILNILIVVLAPRPRRELPVLALALLDVLLLSALFYFAGGAPSGIGNLLLITVSIANFLLRGRLGLLVAAVAAIGLIYLTFYLSLGESSVSQQYVQAAALGTLCFAAALLVQSLTRRLQASESIARQRAADVASLEALNSLILQRMRTGMLVIDQHERVLVANHAALELLGETALVGERLALRCPQLAEQLRHWRGNPSLLAQAFQAHADGPNLQPNFARLRHRDKHDTLIFIEDVSQIAQKAQQMKLASLGRLTASIAHEIRNPLGAISHAAQLLQESEALDHSDRRLVQIIDDQSRRMNLIIENVLQLSRRRQAEPQLLELGAWLRQYVEEFRQGLAPNQRLHLEIIGQELLTRMDPNQLAQVLANLIHNGLRYSGQAHAEAQVWLRLFHEDDGQLPVLDIRDDGAGVAAEQLQHLFEPFFSTESKGTGLGLYISRELCESNRARLDYRERSGGGSCFRIVFARPPAAA